MRYRPEPEHRHDARIVVLFEDELGFVYECSCHEGKHRHRWTDDEKEERRRRKHHHPKPPHNTKPLAPLTAHLA